MTAPSYTYTLTNGTTADASQVQQNFTDVLNGITDGTKDLSLNALACAGTATFNGNVAIGNASGDDLTVTASLASSLIPKTTNLYALGSATKGFSALYLGGNSVEVAIVASGSTSADYTLTLPPAVAAATDTWVLGNGSGVLSFSNTVTKGKAIDGATDEVQLTVEGHSTQTNDVFVVRNSTPTNIMTVAHTNRKTSLNGPLALINNNNYTSTNTIDSASSYFSFSGSTGSQTLTLPSSANLTAGQIIIGVSTASVAVTVAAGSGTTIQGAASISLSADQNRAWIYHGTNWELFGVV